MNDVFTARRERHYNLTLNPLPMTMSAAGMFSSWLTLSVARLRPTTADQITPSIRIASATRTKPAMFAPRT